MKSFQELHDEIVLKNKNGINFILAASICWLLISIIWYLPGSNQNKAFYTFFATMPLMPLAFVFSKVFKTSWNIENNPLNSLGLWLNFAQLFYFPFIFIFFAYKPEQMPMAFAIITGAHFFPYAWFYQTKSYAIIAGIISLSSAIIGTRSIENSGFWVSISVVFFLLVLSVWIYNDYKRKLRSTNK